MSNSFRKFSRHFPKPIPLYKQSHLAPMSNAFPTPLEVTLSTFIPENAFGPEKLGQSVSRVVPAFHNFLGVNSNSTL